MFGHLSADWRKQQDRCLREIEQRQSADQHYLEEGVTILEMARNARTPVRQRGTDAEAAAPQFRCFELRMGEWRAEC